MRLELGRPEQGTASVRALGVPTRTLTGLVLRLGYAVSKGRTATPRALQPRCRELSVMRSDRRNRGATSGADDDARFVG